MDKLLVSILTQIVTATSPELRRIAQELVADLVVRVKDTPNPFDDILAMLLQGIVGKPDESPETN